MKKILFLAIACAALLANGADLTVKNISISIVNKKFKSADTAAAELVNYLGKTVADSLVINGKKIKKIVLVQNDKAAEESWSIKSNGDTLTISGGGRRGMLYGTYHFLEDFIGVRWWNPYEEFVPKAKNIKLNAINVSGKPHFQFRDIYRSEKFHLQDNGRFYARSRLNRRGDHRISSDYGDNFNFGGPYFVHTFARHVGKKYVKTNPEFFALRPHGRDGSQYGGQLCLTNEKMLQAFKKSLYSWINREKKSYAKTGIPAPVIYDISMNDSSCFCICEKCKVEIDKYGLSGYMVNFVNKLARDVKKDYPGLLVSTLAYGPTRIPPKGGIVPEDNLIIRYCYTDDMMQCSIHDKINASEKANIIGWSKISKHMMSWDYGMDWRHNLLQLGDVNIPALIRFYADCNYKGVFLEQSGSWFPNDFYDMKIWLTAKAMENPYQDFDKLRKIYLDGYYGKAGKYIDAYRKVIAEAGRKNSKPSQTTYDDYKYVDLDTLLKAYDLLTKAENSVKNEPVYLRRAILAKNTLNRQCARLLKFYINEWVKRGNKAEDFPVDRIKLANDMRKYWTPEASKSKKPKDVLGMINQEISMVENTQVNMNYKDPAIFAGKEVIHYAPANMIISASPAISMVRDAAAPDGYAVALNANRNPAFALPWAMGIFDTPKGRNTIKQIRWAKAPEKRGYQWHKIAEVDLYRGNYIYLSRMWQVQAKLFNLGPREIRAEVWANFTFEGPKFYKEDKGKENLVKIGRISLVVLKNLNSVVK